MSDSTLKSRSGKQVAALPWRVNSTGMVEFLLVTSRISQHWLLPKGWPIPGKSKAESALQEAFEEAGVKGKTTSRPLGKFNYAKLMHDGAKLHCVVSVFPVRAVKELEEWPEMEQRQRAWFGQTEAAKLVFEGDLATFLNGVALKGDKLITR